MTTIAADGKTMAGDGLITEADYVCCRDYKKVRRLSDGRIVGMAGNAYNWDAFAAWLEANSECDMPKVEDGCWVLVLMPDGKVRQYDEHGRWFEESPPCAIGSGQRFAIAAMDLGKTAGDAVRYASTRDIFTGGEVLELSIEPPLQAVA